MSWREVTKDDVGKKVEVRETDSCEWQVRVLEHILSKPDNSGSKYMVWFLNEKYTGIYKQARIRTSPLPDGWLPDDWRVLGDDEICNRHDLVVWKSMLEEKFTLRKNHLCYCEGEYSGKTAKFIVDGVFCNICVIRPRWRPAAKSDVGKHVSSGIDMGQLKIILNEPDDDGHDCIVYFGGWCVSALKDLKVENEGWNVEN
jgi:hypothetical protein